MTAVQQQTWKEQFEQREKMIHSWFKNHQVDVLYLEPEIPIIRYKWKEPGTNINSLHYIIYGSVLFVCGDLGEAVYQWSQKLTIGFLANCNLDYFAGKCQASETGRRGEDWVAQKAKEMVQFHVDEYNYKGEIPDDEDCYSEHSFSQWIMHDRDDNRYEAFSESMLGCYEPTTRTQCHLIGLQLVHQKLINEANNKDEQSEHKV